jgi:hypothetical protein
MGKYPADQNPAELDERLRQCIRSPTVAVFPGILPSFRASIRSSSRGTPMPGVFRRCRVGNGAVVVSCLWVEVELGAAHERGAVPDHRPHRSRLAPAAGSVKEQHKVDMKLTGPAIEAAWIIGAPWIIPRVRLS